MDQTHNEIGDVALKMPDVIEDSMLAPCGMNCMVCYKHVGAQKHAKPCPGCLGGDVGKPEHCRSCNIKSCVREKGLEHCFECADFSCKLIKNLDKSYTKRYKVSLIENSQSARENGVTAFLKLDRLKWTCTDCGGAFSLHDNVCSDCSGKSKTEATNAAP